MSDHRNIISEVFFLVFGVSGFFWGFGRLRRKRKIENIPTSTIRGLAMGLVEVIGKAKKKNKLVSPFTKTECVFYSYKIEKYQNSGKSGHWVTIAKGESYQSPFFLDDSTGKVLIFPQSAEIIIPVRYRFETGLGKTLPAALVDFMESNNIRYASFLGTYRLRFSESYLLESETVYVMGSAKSAQPAECFEQHKYKLIQRLEELKSKPEILKQFDENNDGQISIEEWDKAVGKIEQNLIDEELQADNQGLGSVEAFINKGCLDEVFIISNYSQKDLIKKLNKELILGIYGGAALALIMLWVLWDEIIKFSR